MQRKVINFYRPQWHKQTHIMTLFTPHPTPFNPPRTRNFLFGRSRNIFAEVILFTHSMYRLRFSFFFHQCSLILISQSVYEILTENGGKAGWYRLCNFTLILFRHQYAATSNQPFNIPTPSPFQRHPFVLPINTRVIEDKGMDLYGMWFVMLLHGADLLQFSVAASVWQKQNFGHQFKLGYNKLISPLPHCLHSS